jgi:hypothetical protein
MKRKTRFSKKLLNRSLKCRKKVKKQRWKSTNKKGGLNNDKDDSTILSFKIKLNENNNF